MESNMSSSGLRKVTARMLTVFSVMAIVFIAGPTLLGYSNVYALPRGEPSSVDPSDQSNACKETLENPQGHLNSNPFCEGQVPIPSHNAEPTSCEGLSVEDTGPHPPFCQPEDIPDGGGWGSRRR